MSRSRLAPLALSLLVCASAVAEDAAAIKALFKQYSPDALYVADAYSKKSKEYERPDFMSYWNASSDDERWRSYARIVHACAVGTMDLYRTDGTMLVLSKDRIYQVPWTSVYYSRIVADEIPEPFRMAHYEEIIVDKANKLSQGTAAGVYGLTGEMAAYYLAAKTTWELLPYLQAQGAKAPWGSFFQAMSEAIADILEFKYYALKYIVYQERDNPQLMRAVMANKVFAKAFVELDAACTAFLKRYFAGREELYDTLRASGWTVREDGATLVIGPKGSGARKTLASAQYTALADELAKNAYRDLLARMNGGSAVESSPTLPGQKLAVQAPDATVKSSLSDAEALKLGGLNIGYGRRQAVITTQKIRALRAASAKIPASAGRGSAAPAASDAVDAALEDIRKGRPSKGARIALKGADDTGDARPGFIDLKSAELRLFPDRLVCAISFAEFPGSLTLNNAGLADGELEYACSLYIDVNGDGKNVYSIALTWFKEEGGEPFEAEPTESCPANLWKSGPDSFEPVEADTSGSAVDPHLVFVLRDGAELPLKKLTAKTAFSVSTLYDTGSGPQEDELEF